jgi:hypothetical protein
MYVLIEYNVCKKVASRFLAPGKIPSALSDSDSEDEPHESSNMAVAIKRKSSHQPTCFE